MSLFGDILGFIDSGRAAKSVSTANKDAQAGVLNATQGATTGIEGQIGKAYNDVGQAGANINTATGTANAGLQDVLARINGGLSPYLSAGAQGAQGLQDYAASNPQFSFDPAKYLNSDAYKFQLNEGTGAIQNKAAAMGLGSGGNVLRDMDSFGQGLASTYYNNAFSQAKDTFQTNQNATLQNLSALINTGEFGTNQFNNANTQIGGQMANNTIGAANTNASLQQFLASLGLQGQEEAGRMSMQGATTAGNFAVGAGQANANGILNQGAALSSGIGDLSSLIFGGGTFGQGASQLFGGKP